MPKLPGGGHVIRVAILDDHPLVRMAIRQAITAPDIEVVAEAETAEQAMLVVPEARPDVLLVDIDLPGLDGSASSASSLHACQTRAS